MAVKIHKEGLGDRRLLDKIDKLRELGVSAQISLPQIVVAGDQGAGKSSVMESLTGFHFPRAANLCTRHATEIICRREREENVAVSIVPHNPTPEKLEAAESFRREIKSLDEDTVKDIFEDAAKIMGIGSDSTFSGDVLRFELSGPTEDHLAVVDIPGVFENPTPGLTTESDMELVEMMVKGYIKEPRTIILAVSPCDGDIANQKILTLAAEFDPKGHRTLGVLTKPDLVIENATKTSIIDVVQGKREGLFLGYCVVRNQGADDTSSSTEARNVKEKEYFASAPWNTLPGDRFGIPALRARIQTLLVNRTKAELPKACDEISRKLKERSARLEDLGESRSTTEEQRRFLGKIVSRISTLKYCGLNAHYSRDPVFDKKPQMRLVTRIREMNDAFSHTMHLKGHNMDFVPDDCAERAPKTIEDTPLEATPDNLYTPQLRFHMPKGSVDALRDILADPFWCPPPQTGDIIRHFDEMYIASRGSELSTLGGDVLAKTFMTQAQKWRPMALAHVSNAISTVHAFIDVALKESCADETVRQQIWYFIDHLLKKSYENSMAHVRLLLKVELGSRVMTYNPNFKAALKRRGREKREEIQEVIASEIVRQRLDTRSSRRRAESPSLSDLAENLDKTVRKQNDTSQEMHVVLRSYYAIALDRFIDAVCRQAVDHFLLHDEDGPLNVISDELVYGMTEAQLEDIAGEDCYARLTRKTLKEEIFRLGQALEVLRAGSAA